MMMGSWRRMLPLAAWIAALVTGIVVFHGLGSGPIAGPPLADPGSWGDWAAGRDPLVATVALLRLGVLALAWYLVGVTTIGLLARLLRAARLVRVADALTVPVVRRLLQSALGVGLATTMVGAATAPVPAFPEHRQAIEAGALEEDRASTGTGQVSLVRAEVGHEPAGITMVRSDDEQAAETVEEPAGPETGQPVAMRLLEQEADTATGVTMRAADDTEPGEVTLRTAAPDDGAEATDDPASAEGSHRVVPGESLWSIAQDVLAHRWEREPTDAEVLTYWEQVIEHNRAGLADPDNPDLLFPGDEVRLPVPPPEA
jgi:nucleoid-associated protein YgaU